MQTAFGAEDGPMQREIGNACDASAGGRLGKNQAFLFNLLYF
jgi:hypothetical protein